MRLTLKKTRNLIGWGVFAGILSLSSPALAEKASSTFQISVSGFRAGIIQLNSATNGSSYSVKGSFKTTGLVSKISNIGYQGSVSGSFRGPRYYPRKYFGNASTGSRKSVVKMSFKNGTPNVDDYTPVRAPQPYNIKTSDQKGTVDPLSTAYMLLRDVDKSELCGKVIHIYDGRRRSRISVHKPVIKGDTVNCTGTYSRVSGFSPKEMKKQINFPFSLDYIKQDDGVYKLVQFATKTTFGTARAKRM